MSHEVQNKQCKVCNQIKVRIQKGTYSNPKNKRWVDENDKQWSGLVCPDCQRKRALVNMHRIRGKERE
jgi:hypothetical protein